MKRANSILTGLVLLLLAVGFTGCDALEGLNPFNHKKDASGIVEAIGPSSLTVDGIEYTVTGDTGYEGVSGLADLSVGDEVEIEYKEKNGGREAAEIELTGAEDGG